MTIQTKRAFLLKKESLGKEKKMKQEIKSLKETCEILSDKTVMESIKKSLKQIAEGKGIPLEDVERGKK